MVVPNSVYGLGSTLGSRHLSGWDLTSVCLQYMIRTRDLDLQTGMCLWNLGSSNKQRGIYRAAWLLISVFRDLFSQVLGFKSVCGASAQTG